ncbi:MAG: 1-phosphofructokinase [Longicatena sp.]
MIITVTFNPAIDKTAEVESLVVGGLNRLKNVRADAGGKGVNVSKTIKALGGTSLCTGFLAGASGKFIETSLDEINILHEFVWVEGSTRTNLKVLDQDLELTELNEAGPIIHQQDIERFMRLLIEHCDQDSIVVLSGNVSEGVNKTIYRDMIMAMKESYVRVILDADGDLFKEGIKAHPTLIKPNKYELATYFNVAQDISNTELIALAKTLLNEDTKLVVVSMGKEGSIFIQEDGVYLVDALSIQAHSSVGAGDAMVGAIAYALEQRMEISTLIRLAVASSAGAVMTKGTKPADKEVVEELMKQVNIKKLEG